MVSEFVPFDATTQQIEARSVLRDGVPASMHSSLTAWVRSRVTDTRGYGVGDRLRAIENNCDPPLGIGMSEFFTADFTRKVVARLDGRALLLATHYLLFESTNWGSDPQSRDSLEKVLAGGRSKWKVGTTSGGTWGLVSRVPAGVQDAAEALIAGGGAAGRLLADAWADVHDFQPNDSTAYANAVKAVEAAALPVLGITSPTATISNAVREIEGKDAAWRLPFLREHNAHPSKDVLLGMLRSLYRGQRDRHGSVDYSGVTHEEALAAVLMAVTLVGLFSGGLIQERDTTQYP